MEQTRQWKNTRLQLMIMSIRLLLEAIYQMNILRRLLVRYLM